MTSSLGAVKFLCLRYELGFIGINDNPQNAVKRLVPTKDVAHEESNLAQDRVPRLWDRQRMRTGFKGAGGADRSMDQFHHEVGARYPVSKLGRNVIVLPPANLFAVDDFLIRRTLKSST